MSTEILKRGKLYAIVGPGRHTFEGLAARWDGRPRRAPRKGELYLSGAKIDAYVALNDLDTPFYIAEAVPLPPREIEHAGCRYTRFDFFE